MKKPKKMTQFSVRTFGRTTGRMMCNINEKDSEAFLWACATDDPPKYCLGWAYGATAPFCNWQMHRPGKLPPKKLASRIALIHRAFAAIRISDRKRNVLPCGFDLTIRKEEKGHLVHLLSKRMRHESIEVELSVLRTVVGLIEQYDSLVQAELKKSAENA